MIEPVVNIDILQKNISDLAETRGLHRTLDFNVINFYYISWIAISVMAIEVIALSRGTWKVVLYPFHVYLHN